MSAAACGAAAEPLLHDVDGRLCGAMVTVGAGRAVVITADVPAQPELFARLLGRLGAAPGLGLQATVPGVTATTTRNPAGERLLHLINPTGYAAVVQVTSGDATGDIAKAAPRLYTAEKLARDIMRGVARNQALIVAPAHGRLAWRGVRLNPGAAVRVAQIAVNRLRAGQKVLIAAIGAGFTWGAGIVEWGIA